MSRPAPARRRVAILGLDLFARKNALQLEEMGARGYAFDVFATAPNRHQSVTVQAPHTLTVLPPGAGARVRAVRAYLAAQRGAVHHAEVYPGGRFSAAYVALARLAGVPVLAVERGDLVNYARLDAAARWSMRRTYRWSRRVWYRELYQERALRALGVRELAFLPNAVRAAAHVAAADARDLDFVWINRLVLERKSGWMVDAFRDALPAGARGAIAGFLPDPADPAIAANQAYARAHAPSSLALLDYAEPGALLARSRFFVLPSDIVFANNALLEAMAHGVVPLVSDVEGARRIVDDGVDGFVFPHTPDGFRAALARALAVSPDEYARLSAAAVRKVSERFSPSAWGDALAGIYATLER